jgi:hypothetical protein
MSNPGRFNKSYEESENLPGATYRSLCHFRYTCQLSGYSPPAHEGSLLEAEECLPGGRTPLLG